MKTTTIIAAVVTMITLAASGVSAAEKTADQGFDTSVHSYLEQVITSGEAKRLVGNSAIIKIAYDKNGAFDQAEVSAAGDVSFARMIHRSVDWKSFPINGKKETIIQVAVNISGNIEVTVR